MTALRIEARSAETERLGPQGESLTAKPERPHLSISSTALRTAARREEMGL